MRAAKDRIVADGGERYRRAKDYKAVRALVVAEVSKRYESEKAQCSFWRRCRLEWIVRREVRARMKREFPSQNLHVSALAGQNV
jgi:hypothetical protein